MKRRSRKSQKSRFAEVESYKLVKGVLLKCKKAQKMKGLKKFEKGLKSAEASPKTPKRNLRKRLKKYWLKKKEMLCYRELWSSPELKAPEKQPRIAGGKRKPYQRRRKAKSKKFRKKVPQNQTLLQE